MCKPASMIETKDKMYWSEKTDSHHEIIAEFGLCESGVRGVNVVPIEIVPPGGNLSLPLSKWVYSIDYGDISREIPEWYDLKVSLERARIALEEWARHRLKGWKLKEAFKPVHPLKVKRDKTLDLPVLLADWASVRASVWASVWASVGASVGASVRASVRASVGDSVRDSVWASVRDSVRTSVWASVGASVRASVGASVRASVGDSVWASVWASVGDSVGAYIGSLFHNIKTWKYTDKKNPWRSLRKLWLGGYVPSFDGKTWRLHAGVKAEVVFEITAEELREKYGKVQP